MPRVVFDQPFQIIFRDPTTEEQLSVHGGYEDFVAADEEFDRVIPLHPGKLITVQAGARIIKRSDKDYGSREL